MSGSLVLGIETSCDETGVGLVRVGDAGNELLVDAIASSVDEHARFGGIIPEVASRAHLEAMVPTLQRALAEAEVELGDIDAIAVTAGPGLVGPLTVGAAAAKALAVGLSRPLYGVNHVIGHVAVDELVHGLFPERFLALVVSGGHSSLLLVDDIATGVTELGQTLDDAAGEAFDKVGRLLGLPYPGGPHIDRLAQQGAVTIRFPRGLTAGEEVPLADVAASFAEAVADVLTAKTVAACLLHEVDTLVIGGGFSANSQLRAMAQRSCAIARSWEFAENPPPITRVSTSCRRHAATVLAVRTSATASAKDAATSGSGTSSPASWRASTQRATAVFRPEKEKSYAWVAWSFAAVSPRGKRMVTAPCWASRSMCGPPGYGRPHIDRLAQQ